MSKWIKITSKAEAEAALNTNPNAWLDIIEGKFSLKIEVGSPWVRVSASAEIELSSWGTSTLRAVSLETSTLRAISRGTSTLTAVSWGTSTLTAVSWGTSTLTAESRGTSTLRAESWETSTLTAVSWETSTLTAVSRETSTLRAESWGTSTLTAVSRETSTLRAESWETSTLRAESWETSTLRAESWETSTLRAVSWGTSTLTAVSRGYSRAIILGKITLKAAMTASVIRRDGLSSVEGGIVQNLDISTPETWCEFYGLPVVDGVVSLFKGVDDDFSTDRARQAGIFYHPGNAPEAPDWDGGEAECGGGLHASPSPSHTLEFHSSAKRFVTIPVNLTDIVVHPNGQFPQKVKFRAACGPCLEVDRHGERIDAPKGACVMAATIAEALREPTPEMVEKGRAAFLEALYRPDEVSNVAILKAWRAMLTASPLCGGRE